MLFFFFLDLGWAVGASTAPRFRILGDRGGDVCVLCGVCIASSVSDIAVSSCVDVVGSARGGV